MSPTTVTDWEAVALARAQSAQRLQDGLEHMEAAIDALERAAVAMTGADLPTSGARITVTAAVIGARLHTKNLHLEQAALVEGYADALRRAEAQTPRTTA